MKKMDSKANVYFGGLSVEEIEKRTEKTYQEVVRPQVEKERTLRKQGLLQEHPELSSFQKMYASCQSVV